MRQKKNYDRGARLTFKHIWMIYFMLCSTIGKPAREQTHTHSHAMRCIIKVENLSYEHKKHNKQMKRNDQTWINCCRILSILLQLCAVRDIYIYIERGILDKSSTELPSWIMHHHSCQPLVADQIRISHTIWIHLWQCGVYLIVFARADAIQ